jgi:hypothetical protein
VFYSYWLNHFNAANSDLTSCKCGLVRGPQRCPKIPAHEPRTGAVFIFKNLPPKPHLHVPLVGSQYGATEAAEILIAHLDSQRKPAMPRHENRKM